MKRIYQTIIGVAAAAALLAVTCPGQEKHQKVIKDKFNKAVAKEIAADESQEDNPMASLFTGMWSDLVDSFIENNLEVRNYGLFSLGKVGDEKKTLTAGVLGMVFFTPGKKNLSMNQDFHYSIDDDDAPAAPRIGSGRL